MEEILTAFLSKTLNIDTSELASLVKNEDETIKDNALDILLSKEKERVERLKSSDSGKGKEMFDNGYKKGTKEALTNVEKSIKERYEFDSELTGIDLVDSLLSFKAETNKGEELTPEKIKGNKFFLDAVDAHKRKLEEIDNNWRTKFEEQDLQFKKAQTFQTIERKANAIIDSLNPILSEDAQKAARQKQVVINELKNGNYDIQGDRIVMLDKDGNLQEDDLGNRIEFSDRVKSITSEYYDFKVAGERSSAGEKKTDKGNPAFNVVKPANGDEFIAAIAKATSLEEKQAITKAYQGE